MLSHTASTLWVIKFLLWQLLWTNIIQQIDSTCKIDLSLNVPIFKFVRSTKSLTTGRIQVTKANKLVSNYLVRENERVPGIIAAYLTH